MIGARFQLAQYKMSLFLIVGMLAIFVGRTLLAVHNSPPRLFDLFNTLTILGSIIVLLKWYSSLKLSDWMLATGLGVVVGVGMCFATLFSPYPFFGIVRDNVGQAFVRGAYTMLAMLGGLTIMRRGGPIRFLAGNHRVGGAARNFLFGFCDWRPVGHLECFSSAIFRRTVHCLAKSSIRIIGCAPACHRRGSNLSFCTVGIALADPAKIDS